MWQVMRSMTAEETKGCLTSSGWLLLLLRVIFLVNKKYEP